MSRPTLNSIKLSRIPCGFCATGNRHDLCPGGVLNGDGKTLVLCKCTEHEPVIRCLHCNAKGDGVDDGTWLCSDPDACQERKDKHLRETVKDLYGDFEGEDAPRTAPRSEKPKKTPSVAKGGKCLCCGEPTKGGLFLPGHDSKFLTRYVEVIRNAPDQAVALRDTLATWIDLGTSPALQNKLAKRVAL